MLKEFNCTLEIKKLRLVTLYAVSNIASAAQGRGWKAMEFDDTVSYF
jgi:hypothetical protein